MQYFGRCRKINLKIMRFNNVSFAFLWLISGVLAGIVGKALAENYRIAGSFKINSITLGGQAEEIQRLKEEIQRLRADNENLVRELMTGQIGQERVKEELFNAKMLGGLLPVEGSGVEVRLADTSEKNQLSEFGIIEEGLVHDYDILYLLNELKAGGAEAISITSGNLEERVLSTSFVRCTGPTIIVNNQKLTAPFMIKAIGDPQILFDALTMRGGIVEQLKRYGLLVTVIKKEKLRIAGYSLPIKFNFAEFAEEENEKGVDFYNSLEK